MLFFFWGDHTYSIFIYTHCTMLSYVHIGDIYNTLWPHVPTQVANMKGSMVEKMGRKELSNAVFPKNDGRKRR